MVCSQLKHPATLSTIIQPTSFWHLTQQYISPFWSEAVVCILGRVIGKDGSDKLLMIEQKESNTIIKWIVENVGGSQHHNQLQYIIHL
jgi:hypothetical protein